MCALPLAERNLHIRIYTYSFVENGKYSTVLHNWGVCGVW